MSKKHLTYDDRLAIQAGLQQGLKVTQIARNMGNANVKHFFTLLGKMFFTS